MPPEEEDDSSWLSVGTTWDPEAETSEYVLTITFRGQQVRKMRKKEAIAFALAVLTVCAQATTMTAIVEHLMKLSGDARLDRESASRIAAAAANRFKRAPASDLHPFDLLPVAGRSRSGGEFASAIVSRCKADIGWPDESFQAVAVWEQMAYVMLETAAELDGDNAYFSHLIDSKAGEGLAADTARLLVYDMTDKRGLAAETRVQERLSLRRLAPVAPPAAAAEQPGGPGTFNVGPATGQFVEVTAERISKLPGVVETPGVHTFVASTIFAVSDPTGQLMLDHENLVQAMGPFCMTCEQHWTPGMEKTPCTGEPDPEGSQR